MQPRVTDNRAVSEAFVVTNGVKQGCVLAPTLFALMFAAMLTGRLRRSGPEDPLRRQDRRLEASTRYSTTCPSPKTARSTPKQKQTCAPDAQSSQHPSTVDERSAHELASSDISGPCVSAALQSQLPPSRPPLPKTPRSQPSPLMLRIPVHSHRRSPPSPPSVEQPP
ncbi:hypothetical protein SprV_0301314400 [Sparganum proliferum]